MSKLAGESESNLRKGNLFYERKYMIVHNFFV